MPFLRLEDVGMKTSADERKVGRCKEKTERKEDTNELNKSKKRIRYW